MTRYFLFINLVLLCVLSAFGQYEYDVSKDYPFGRANPEAPEQVKDFEPMIGECDCISVLRKQDGTWAEEEEMLWRFKYILNGMGIQDESFRKDGSYSGSVRQYIADSSRWYVHWYSSKGPTTTLPTWEGNKNDEGNIVLYKEQKAPNGMDGGYRLTFYEMSPTGFKWIGEWVDTSGSIVYPTWKIDCKKRQK